VTATSPTAAILATNFGSAPAGLFASDANNGIGAEGLASFTGGTAMLAYNRVTDGSGNGLTIRRDTPGSALIIQSNTGGTLTNNATINVDGTFSFGLFTNPSFSMNASAGFRLNNQVNVTNGTLTVSGVVPGGSSTNLTNVGPGTITVGSGTQFASANLNSVATGNVFSIKSPLGAVVYSVDAAGNESKAGGNFRIDHPLDPANKYLLHSFVESPDMMNIYNGVVVLDHRGTAWVTMPDWFEALNQDFRYQLTAIGAPGPNLYIAQEISHNRFKIAGGKSGSKVSWQVTGIRHDAWANTHRIKVEEDKPADQRGKYMSPEQFSNSAQASDGGQQ
jgi:hypothetical protein